MTLEVLPETEKHRVAGFFPDTRPAKTLLYAYLQDVVPGITYVDNAKSPSWCICIAEFHHISFVGWTTTAFDLTSVLTEILKEELYLDLAWDDACPLPRPESLIKDRFSRLEFLTLNQQTFTQAHEQSQDTDGTVSVVDERLFDLCESKDEALSGYEFKERFLRHCHALVLTQEGRYLSDASGILPYREKDGAVWADIQVVTAGSERRKGYALKVVCALIGDFQEKGIRPVWSCHKDNAPSAGLAQRLGFTEPREFEILGLNARPPIPAYWVKAMTAFGTTYENRHLAIQHLREKYELPRDDAHWLVIKYLTQPSRG